MSGPDPRVAAIRSAVTDAVADLPDGALVLVACSGGPDSLALAAGLAFVADRSRRAERPVALRAGAVVVDHGLQPGSSDAAAAAADACRRLGLDPVLVVAVDVAGPGGPEAAARAARHDAFEKAASDTGAAAVLLGHTLDDQAETVLLGLARGSGARSLAGMPATRGVLRRPLLALRRADTVAACEALGLEPWHDPTNAADHPAAGARSRVRDRVLPVLEDVLGPGVAAALARTAAQLREDAAALDALAGVLLADATQAVTGRHDGLVGLDCATLAAAPDAVRRRALRAAALTAGCPGGALHRTHVLALDALVVGWHGQGPAALPGRREGRRSYGTLVLGPGRDAAGGDEQFSPQRDEQQER
ncbi:tRNA(Ile)-lysidine synthase [Cellulomonas chitinilytica]|uniref:tRNA(Ile)-lysidine synthase n=1 Tax=Cellulomonas chitinilytica TaxID=398759 RepID=A0A919P412_9CELL|nr:tRNA lysidine(34) synthetase TilS [Cellulomonas chitinilytica]GIG23051.1 tRNA(Ile)-lysidine synthase [Cellulomonas chitinilytica]